MLRHIPTDRPFDFSKELFPLLLEMGRPIYGYVCDGYWQDIGNLDQYRQANFDALDEKVRLNIPGLKIRGRRLDRRGRRDRRRRGGRGARVHRQLLHGLARVVGRPVHGARARHDAARARARLAVGDRRVDATSAAARRSRARSSAATATSAPHARVHEGVAIGDQVTLGDQSVIYPGVRIYPYKEVEYGAQIHESLIWESRGSTKRVRAGRRRRARQRRPDARDRRAPRRRARHRAQARRARRREPRERARVPDDQAGADLGAQLDRRAGRRPAHAAGPGRQAPAEDAELRRGLPRRRHRPPTPRPCRSASSSSPGVALSAALQKEIEKHFTRQELRRVPFAAVGSITYPARARESYASDLLADLDVDGDPRARLPDRRRLRLLGRRASSCRSCSARSASRRSPRTRSSRTPAAAPARFGETIDQARRLVEAVERRPRRRLRPVGRAALPDRRDAAARCAADQALLLFLRAARRARRTGKVAVPVTATSQVEEVAGGRLEVIRTPASLHGPDAGGRRRGRRLRRRAGRRLRLPRLPARLRRERVALQAARAARAGRRAALASSSRRCRGRRSIHRQVQCPWALKGTVMRVLNERFADANVDLRDGIKIFDERGWVQVLPDADEPLVHLYAEGESGGGLRGARDRAAHARHRRDRAGGDRRPRAEPLS